MKIHEILNEKITSVVYHVIGFNGAHKALQQNAFKQKEISVTRSLTGDYHLSNKMIGVIFELDGDLINRKYKGGPVGTEDWDENDELVHRGKENKQLEDRIYTDDGLSPLSKYITSAILFCPIEFVESNSEDEFDEIYADSVQAIPSVIALLKKQKIPFRYVSTVKELYNKNANNKKGFLNAVASVDESVAGELGLDIKKEFTVYITMAEKLPAGEIDDYTGTDTTYNDIDPFEVMVNTPEAALKQAQAKIADYNKGKDENLKKAGDSYLFIDEIRGAGNIYEVNSDGTIYGTN